MAYIDFMSVVHRSTQRDYLGRVNDPEYPKHKAATLAKEYGYDYWDGDRRINYGGYKYIPDKWKPIACAIIDTYNLKNGDNILSFSFIIMSFIKNLTNFINKVIPWT